MGWSNNRRQARIWRKNRCNEVDASPSANLLAAEHVCQCLRSWLCHHRRQALRNINATVTLWQNFKVWSHHAPYWSQKRLSSFDFVQYLCRTQPYPDRTLDNARLEIRCPVNTFACPSPPGFPPVSLTGSPWKSSPRFCCSSKFLPSLASALSVVTQCSLSTQSTKYTAIIEHWPDIIRATVSIQVDAFDCYTVQNALYDRSTCNCFGHCFWTVAASATCVSPRGPSSSPAQVAKHTGSPPPTQSHRTILGAFANFCTTTKHPEPARAILQWGEQSSVEAASTLRLPGSGPDYGGQWSSPFRQKLDEIQDFCDHRHGASSAQWLAQQCSGSRHPSQMEAVPVHHTMVTGFWLDVGMEVWGCGTWTWRIWWSIRLALRTLEMISMCDELLEFHHLERWQLQDHSNLPKSNSWIQLLGRL